MNHLKKYLFLEAGIELKACLYFAVMLAFYFFYQIMQGSLNASIVLMIEMVLAVYVMCYLQVLFMHNFDESEQLDKRTLLLSAFCSAVYAAVSYLLNWYDKNVLVTVCFWGYMLFCHLCVFLLFKIRRDIDTVTLNRELEEFKQRKKEDSDKEDIVNPQNAKGV